MTTPFEHPADPFAAVESEVGWPPAPVADWGPADTDPAAALDTAPARSARPARLALGLASLAADRLRGGVRTNDTLAVTVGLLGRTADGSAAFARWVSSPPARAARRGASWASGLPGVKRLRGPVERARVNVARMTSEARVRGQATVTAGRDDATAFVKVTVDDTISWAQAQAVPRIIDGLVPQLVNEVVPKIIEGAMPEIKEHVLPAVIEDLANEPAIRDLIMEQSRSALSDAAGELRSSTASADDRVESAFRRIFHGTRAESADEPPTVGETPADEAGGPTPGG